MENIKKILNTKAHSAERAHEVENIIDTKLSHAGLEYTDMLPIDLQDVKKDLKSARDIDYIAFLLNDLDDIIRYLIADNNDTKEVMK